VGSWELRRIAVIGLMLLLFGVFGVDAFGPEDFSPGAYVAPILLALGGLFADTLIRPRNGNGKNGKVNNGASN